MTKQDMARAISDHTGVSRAQALAIVQGVFDGIMDALVTAGRMELRNFGVFEAKTRRSRKARNPHTGERLVLPARLVVTCKPGRALKEWFRQSKNVPSEDDKSV
jgi:integration host factor subunit beta